MTDAEKTREQLSRAVVDLGRQLDDLEQAHVLHLQVEHISVPTVDTCYRLINGINRSL